MQKEILNVNGMTCGHCKKGVELALEDIGVQAEANLNDKTVTVEFNEKTQTLEAIKEAIKEEGYQVV